MNKISFAKIVNYSVSKFSRVFDLFEAKLSKVIVYFIFLNLMVFIPVTYQLLTLENVDYSKYGMDFHEDIPDWLPNDLPKGCEIKDFELRCDTANVYEYEIRNRDKTYTILMNVTDDVYIEDENTIIMYKNGFNINFENQNVLRFTYSGFDNVKFADLSDLEQDEAANILFEGMFQSIKPTLVLPIIIFFVGGMMLMNFILIITIAGISMLFSLNQSDFPSYKNMIKLMIFASTIPSVINLALGFFTLSAFTAISYNIITPILAYFMYRASRVRILSNL